ncbi:MAG: M42 family metallopeptidase [Armatimonadetes bacterium]|nr:M42 family metallopeptidase [Armatimonadota bacterium]
MRKPSLDFLKALLEAPSPSGYEQPAMRIVREYVQGFADEVKTDVHGNVVAALNPSGSPRVMLAGHCDQIGMMVQYINDDGYLYFAAIGGIDTAVLAGLRVRVHTSHGAVPGVIGRTAIHVLPAEERSKLPAIEKLWIDIGAKDRKAAQKLVTIGDPITFDVPVVELQQDLLAAPGVDDKIGGQVCMEALRLLSGEKLSCAVFAVATVQEEIGLRGAVTSSYHVNPDVGIAVDVTHTTDYPGSEKTKIGEVSLGKGPVLDRGANINPRLWQLLLDTAREAKIPVQLLAAPRGTGTDANVMQLNRGGVATALVGIPNRYMHTPSEVISLGDAEKAARLIASAVKGLTSRVSFVPE